MENTPEAILGFAAKRAQETWDADQQPYMLARLSPELAQAGLDYRSILGEKRLKDFLQGSPTRIKVVSHPTQKSKIGLIPHDRNFEYPTYEPTGGEPDTGTSAIGKSKQTRRWYIVSNFLKLLSELMLKTSIRFKFQRQF